MNFFEEQHNFDLEGILKKSDNFTLLKQNSQGFMLTDEFAKVEYVYSDLAGQNRLYLTFKSKPVIYIEGGINFNKNQYSFYANSIQILDSDPADNPNCKIIAEIEAEQEIKPSDFNNDMKIYDFVKFLKNNSQKNKAEVNNKEEFLKIAEYLMMEISEKSKLIEHYASWMISNIKPLKK